MALNDRVIIVKSKMGPGYYLIIRSEIDGIENRWAVTGEELIMLKHKLQDMVIET